MGALVVILPRQPPRVRAVQNLRKPTGVAVTFASNSIGQPNLGFARERASLTSVSHGLIYLFTRRAPVSRFFGSRSARNLSVFSRTNRMLAWYSVIAVAPSLARSSFLKLASARARASSILVVNVISYSADEMRCIRTPHRPTVPIYADSLDFTAPARRRDQTSRALRF
jgi:hypothetical protein